jgi:hypothetical protein
MRLTPHGYDADVRLYRASDLDRCADMIERGSIDIDWAMRWSPAELGEQLAGPSFVTLVHERDGRVEGMVNCHCFRLHGRELIRCAMIDLWAHQNMNFAERVRLVGHLCTHLRNQGVHAVVAPRSTAMPTGALLANLFVPGAQHFRIGIFPTKRTPPDLAPPRTWSFEIT